MTPLVMAVARAAPVQEEAAQTALISNAGRALARGSRWRKRGGGKGEGRRWKEGGVHVRPVTKVRTSKARTNGSRLVAMTPCLMAPDLAALRSALKRCWRSSAGKLDG